MFIQPGKVKLINVDIHMADEKFIIFNAWILLMRIKPPNLVFIKSFALYAIMPI